MSEAPRNWSRIRENVSQQWEWYLALDESERDGLDGWAHRMLDYEAEFGGDWNLSLAGPHTLKISVRL